MNGLDVPNDISIAGDNGTASKQEMNGIFIPAPQLAKSRYNRQMLVPTVALSGQERISAAKVLIIGLGGLGAPAALYLTGAGVGQLGLLDNDVIELSNLHRQVIHREGAVKTGMTKVQSALQACRELNSEVKLVGHDVKLELTNNEAAAEILQIVEEYDIVLDCTDNPATRYLISDLCVVLGKPLVSGAAQRLEGQLLVLNNHSTDGERGPCYRCVFPKPPNPELTKGCGEIGIVGPVVGTIGTLMASEALRLIVKGEEEPRKPTMLMYNAWSKDPRSMFRTIGLRGRRKDCIACGDADVIVGKGLQPIDRQVLLTAQHNYAAFCGVPADVKILPLEQRVGAVEFLRTISSDGREQHTHDPVNSRRWHRPLIIDTRETYEVELGPKISSSLNIPFSKIQQTDGDIHDIEEKVDTAHHDAVIFLCQRGNDSQIAAEKLLSKRSKEKLDNLFIGDVTGGFVALENVHANGEISQCPSG